MTNLYSATDMRRLLMDFLRYLHLRERKIGNKKFLLSFHLFFSKILPYQLSVQIRLWLSVLNYPLKHSLLYSVDLQELRKHPGTRPPQFPIRFASRALSDRWGYSASLAYLSFRRSSRPGMYLTEKFSRRWGCNHRLKI